MDERQIKRLESGLRSLGIRHGGNVRDSLVRYIEEIELWNPRYGLLAPGEDIVNRHVLDSLSGWEAIHRLRPARLADVGSGAGFPGIPLAVMLPDCSVTLIERMGRRAGFLRNVAAVLGLRNVSVLEKPVENVTAGEAGFDVVTFRAWSAIDRGVLSAMRAILAPDGVIAAYKGRRDTIDGELLAVTDQIAESDVHPLPSFGDGGERHLVVLKPAAAD